MKRVFVGALVALALPLSASAADTSILQGLIAQLKALQSSLVQVTTGTPIGASVTPQATGGCLLFAAAIRPGTKSDDVTRLQQFLARDITLYPDAQITGFYGPMTVAAVRRFQVLRGIVSEGTPETTGFGSAGLRTIAVINASLCPKPAQAVANPDPMNTGNAIVPMPSSIQVNTSAGGKTVALGTGISVSWASISAPANSVVRVSLVRADGSTVGVIEATKPISGSLFWTLPLPPKQCTGNAASCLGQIADQCVGSLCALDAGRYAVRVDLMQGSVSLAHAQAASFVVGSVAVTATSSGTSDALAQLVAQTASGTVPTTTSTAGISQDILSLLTALNAGSAGTGVATTSVAPPTLPVPAGSCTTPWGSQHVASGQQITYEPFFTGGQYTGATINVLAQCNSGKWSKCDQIGDHCVPFSTQ